MTQAYVKRINWRMAELNNQPPTQSIAEVAFLVKGDNREAVLRRGKGEVLGMATLQEYAGKDLFMTPNGEKISISKSNEHYYSPYIYQTNEGIVVVTRFARLHENLRPPAIQAYNAMLFESSGIPGVAEKLTTDPSSLPTITAIAATASLVAGGGMTDTHFTEKWYGWNTLGRGVSVGTGDRKAFAQIGDASIRSFLSDIGEPEPILGPSDRPAVECSTGTPTASLHPTRKLPVNVSRVPVEALYIDWPEGTVFGPVDTRTSTTDLPILTLFE